jgi:hypothetical protein
MIGIALLCFELHPCATDQGDAAVPVTAVLITGLHSLSQQFHSQQLHVETAGNETAAIETAPL